MLCAVGRDATLIMLTFPVIAISFLLFKFFILSFSKMSLQRPKQREFCLSHHLPFSSVYCVVIVTIAPDSAAGSLHRQPSTVMFHLRKPPERAVQYMVGTEPLITSQENVWYPHVTHVTTTLNHSFLKEVPKSFWKNGNFNSEL